MISRIVNVRLDRTTASRLDKLVRSARRNGLEATRSTLIRQAVRQWLEQEEEARDDLEGAVCEIQGGVRNSED